jgi:hypothetical protein
VHRKYIPIYIQQDATLHSLFICGNCSTCNVASCWIYIGILLGAHPILHVSRIRVKQSRRTFLIVRLFPTNPSICSYRLHLQYYLNTNHKQAKQVFLQYTRVLELAYSQPTLFCIVHFMNKITSFYCCQYYRVELNSAGDSSSLPLVYVFFFLYVKRNFFD